MTDYKELRALSDAATDGEWRFKKEPDQFIMAGEHEIIARISYLKSERRGKANARFIAATDPQTVRALIDEVEQLRGALKDIADGPEPLGDYITGIRCGVEDRDLYDRYECAEYGYEEGLDYCAFIAKQALKGTGHE